MLSLESFSRLARLGGEQSDDQPMDIDPSREDAPIVNASVSKEGA
jgi:multicomponent K+:H+ antiporter subunit A